MRKVVDDLKQGMGEKKEKQGKEEGGEGIGASSVKAATLNMITQVGCYLIHFLLLQMFMTKIVHLHIDTFTKPVLLIRSIDIII